MTTKTKPTGRPYSLAYTAAGTPRRYLLSGIPAQLWIQVRAQAKREHLAVRQVILMMLESWLATAPSRNQFAETREIARAAIPPEVRRELAEKAARAARRHERQSERRVERRKPA